MSTVVGIGAGFVAWFIVRYLVAGFYTVDQNERAVITSFGRAERVGDATTLDDPISESLVKDEEERYSYPQVRVVQPGFYWKWPWQRVYKVSIATETTNMAYDPDDPQANQGGTMLEAVTKDQLNIGLDGQIRYRVSEANLYAYLFGVKNPIAHVMGYFVSVLRERIANFEAPPVPATDAGGELTSEAATAAMGISINDLRKNLRDLNEHMDQECRIVGRSVRHGARCLADHRHRSAAGGGVGAGGDQHGPQPGVVGHQPGAGGGRPEDRAVQTGRGDRNAEGPGGGRAAGARWPSQLARTQAERAPTSLRAYVRNVRLSLFGKADEGDRGGGLMIDGDS